jgi:hypothetical protein
MFCRKKREGGFDFARRHHSPAAWIDIGFRNDDRCPYVTDFREVGRGAGAGAGAVLFPLMDDQPFARHQVQHVVDQLLRHPFRRRVAKFRIAVFILRPEPVNDEGIGPLAGTLRPIRLGAFGGAIAWRPGQRQNVEIKIAGLVLPESRAAEKKQRGRGEN